MGDSIASPEHLAVTSGVLQEARCPVKLCDRRKVKHRTQRLRLRLGRPDTNPTLQGDRCGIARRLFCPQLTSDNADRKAAAGGLHQDTRCANVPHPAASKEDPQLALDE